MIVESTHFGTLEVPTDNLAADARLAGDVGVVQQASGGHRRDTEELGKRRKILDDGLGRNFFLQVITDICP